jgi:hypothetical protein
MDLWWVLVDAVMNRQIPRKIVNVLTNFFFSLQFLLLLVVID